MQKSGNTPAIARDTVAAWMTERGLSMQAVGKRCGYNEATISRYLGGTMTGDTAALERSLRDMMAADARRRTWASTYFDTLGSSQMETLLDLIRESGDFGLLTGPAGVGKTTSAAHYVAAHDSSMMVTLTEGRGDNWSIVRMIYDQFDVRIQKGSKPPAGIARNDAVFSRLTNSDRLLVVDNAQRATLSGLRWLFDLNDKTGIPIALVGNPDVLTRVGCSDQLYSRIGLRADVGSGTWLDEAADKALAALWPDAPAEVRLLARETARQPGHLRRLVKQARIAIRLTESPSWKKSAAAAFVEARGLIGANVEED